MSWDREVIVCFGLGEFSHEVVVALRGGDEGSAAPAQASVKARLTGDAGSIRDAASARRNAAAENVVFRRIEQRGVNAGGSVDVVEILFESELAAVLVHINGGCGVEIGFAEVVRR